MLSLELVLIYYTTLVLEVFYYSTYSHDIHYQMDAISHEIHLKKTTKLLRKFHKNFFFNQLKAEKLIINLVLKEKSGGFSRWPSTHLLFPLSSRDHRPTQEGAPCDDPSYQYKLNVN